MERLGIECRRPHPLQWRNLVTEADASPWRLIPLAAVTSTGGAGRDDMPGSWHEAFLEALAATSNVTASADAAGISASFAYRTRRNNADFAAAWRAALLEGYEHLELETLERLRMGTDKDAPKFDIANALRLLALHKDRAGAEQAHMVDRNEEEIFASIDAKLAQFRAREENVARMLSEDGIGQPQATGGNG